MLTFEEVMIAIDKGEDHMYNPPLIFAISKWNTRRPDLETRLRHDEAEIVGYTIDLGGWEEREREG